MRYHTHRVKLLGYLTDRPELVVASGLKPVAVAFLLFKIIN